MDWFDRIGFAIAGGSFVAVMWMVFGGVTFGGDFAANVAGATIGGFISVGLALYMFNRQQLASAKVLSDQQDLAAANAEYENLKNRAHTITRSLRYIHSIRDAVKAAKTMTAHDGERIINVVGNSGLLVERVLREDLTLTDFDLRFAMEEAAAAARGIEKTLRIKFDEAKKTGTIRTSPVADMECDACIGALEGISAQYRWIRNGKEDWELAL